MTEGIEGQLETKINKSEGFKENNKVFSALEKIVNGYEGEYLVFGGIGVQGATGKEYRVTHDLDICVSEEKQDEFKKYLETIGFSPKSKDNRLLGSGSAMSDGEVSIDIINGVFSEKGLVQNMDSGNVFIPKEGINNIVTLRGVTFRTFTPEVHYFLKDRAVSRNPRHTINPFVNRKQDEMDYLELKKIINPDKAKELLKKGFSYKGRHPWLGKFFQ
jgi:hypothetical protein